jgi:hypothetical protein
MFETSPSPSVRWPQRFLSHQKNSFSRQLFRKSLCKYSPLPPGVSVSGLDCAVPLVLTCARSTLCQQNVVKEVYCASHRWVKPGMTILLFIPQVS